MDPQIYWSDKIVFFLLEKGYFCFNKAVTIRMVATKQLKTSGNIINNHKSTPSLSLCDDFSNASPVVAVVGLEEFAQICEDKSLEAYLFQ